MQVYLVGRSIHYVKTISLVLEKQLSNKIFYFFYDREKNSELSKQQNNVEGKKCRGVMVSSMNCRRIMEKKKKCERMDHY